MLIVKYINLYDGERRIDDTDIVKHITQKYTHVFLFLCKRYKYAFQLSLAFLCVYLKLMFNQAIDFNRALYTNTSSMVRDFTATTTRVRHIKPVPLYVCCCCCGALPYNLKTYAYMLNGSAAATAATYYSIQRYGSFSQTHSLFIHRQNFQIYFICNFKM